MTARAGRKERSFEEAMERLEAIVTEIQSALGGGAKEVVLTGVQLGAWGRDFRPPRRLPDLLTAILSRTAVPRLRLSSLEPWDLEADFFDLWSEPRLCRHLHLPLQSGSAGVLKRMRRKTAPESFAGIVAAARRAVPELAVTTDVIVGFPGESQAEFAETLEYVQGLQFAGGHVFTYSARPGTPAARMKGQVRPEVRKERSAILRAAFEETGRAYRRRFIGQTLAALWESTARRIDSGWELGGLTDNYLRVSAIAPQPRWNQIDPVRLVEEKDHALIGLLLEAMPNGKEDAISGDPI